MSPPQRKAPRIAFLGARGVPARYGGFETFVEEIGARLVRRGIEVTVYCEAQRNELQPSKYRGMDLRYVRPWAPGPLRTIQTDVEALVRASGHDIVYLLGYGAAFGAVIPRLLGRAVWINPDGVEWKRSKWGRVARAWLAIMERVACRVASRVVFDNAALGDEVMSRTPVKTHSTLAYGADVLDRIPDAAPLRTLGLAADGYDLVLCRFEPENHVAEIVAAHRKADTGRPLVVVAHKNTGTAYARHTMQSAAADVRFVGAIYDQDALRALRRHARLYLHGHSVGGTNPSLLEAMGTGCVVLSHDNLFNREVLGGTGLYWRDGNELVDCIRAWSARSAAERDAERARGQSRIESSYCWESLADDYAQLVMTDARGHAPLAHTDRGVHAIDGAGGGPADDASSDSPSGARDAA